MDALPPEMRKLSKIAENSETDVKEVETLELPRNELEPQTCAPTTKEMPPPTTCTVAVTHNSQITIMQCSSYK